MEGGKYEFINKDKTFIQKKEPDVLDAKPGEINQKSKVGSTRTFVIRY